MDQATEHEAAPIEELLSAYRGLQSQFDLVRERLRRAEDNRHTVARRIYDRVRLDYDRELDAIRARLTPLRDELDRLHESIEAQRGEVAAALQAVEEELAETEFRHRIGEYPDHTYVEMRGALDGRAGDARVRQASLQASLDAIAALRSPGLADTADGVSRHVPETADDNPSTGDVAAEFGINADTAELGMHADAAEDDLGTIVIDEPPTLARENAAPPAPRPVAEEASEGSQPVVDAERVPPDARMESFENPQQWVRDIGSDATRAERRVRLSAPAPVAPRKPSVSEEIDSVLAPLNAQAATPAIVERAARASTSTAPAAPDLPSLVFVSGPHTGQAIALLPTTLTIGREHDNNVEIKDPEVARYHARILRERDDFVVEDLNSTTGTWVNGERKSRAVLSHGDVIRVGQTELALDFEWTTDSR